MLLAGGLLPNPARVSVWAAAAAADLATPALARRALTRAAFTPDHLQERFGLFVIIALGESIVAIGAPAAAAAHLDAAVLAGPNRQIEHQRGVGEDEVAQVTIASVCARIARVSGLAAASLGRPILVSAIAQSLRLVIENRRCTGTYR